MPPEGTGVPLPLPARLSPSSIETFRQCPLKFKFSRIDKLREPPTDATTLGSFVHAVLEDLYALPAAERTLATARTLMATQWHENWAAQAEEILSFDTDAIHRFRWQAWWCVENHFAIENPQRLEPGGIETELVGEIDGVPMRGFIDRWDRQRSGLKVVDYKTGKTPRPQWASGKFFQLLIYADMLAARTGEPVTNLELQYLKDGVPLRRTVTPSELDEMRRIVTEAYDGIRTRGEAGQFEPTPNRLCDWCHFKPMCPAWN
jgi:putative RecB family exonuclease